jgi:heme-degrading monooxygenase HmoA
VKIKTPTEIADEMAALASEIETKMPGFYESTWGKDVVILLCDGAEVIWKSEENHKKGTTNEQQDVNAHRGGLTRYTARFRL